MRLLFDHNLSPDLVALLSDLYPESIHVWDLEMDAAADILIWAYALEGGFVIVTKDADYRDLSAARGHYPKVIWIRLDNCPTSDEASLLRNRHDDLTNFSRYDRSGLLEPL